ncbi:aromatic ring-hydroxylating dioxygenase subunit alpha [Amycolatopsis sp. NBC_00345]|uniref:aromatic ring-hydroxylating oxygenase subunit alpha n=1 Tax=Amycolatopsis sp. NBC_00345 TaxID=2975955 RepID=UPI002E25BD77
MPYQDLMDFDKVGSLNPEVLHSEEIYRRELATVFARSWLFLTHESQLPKPGDFVTALMGEDPVLVTRQRDGGLKAFLNVCRHRGMRVCRQDLGNTQRFTCSYHGWSYNSAGTLVDVPMEDHSYHNRLDKPGWSLLQVPRIETYHGLVFGCWDEEVPPLADYLAGAAPLLDPMLTRYEDVEFVGPMKWRLVGNWKLAAEQFASDGYHGGTTHASAASALGTDLTAMGKDENSLQLGTALGHAGALVTPAHLPLTMRQGETGAALPELRVAHMNVFPNFSALGSGLFRVWQPRGTGEMEIWSWVMVPAGADDETRRALLNKVSLSFSATGIVEVDDSENWSEIQAASRGHIARRLPLNYQMGFGLDRDDDRIPPFDGKTGHMTNDIGARYFYTRWAELLDGEPLTPAPSGPALL